MSSKISSHPKYILYPSQILAKKAKPHKNNGTLSHLIHKINPLRMLPKNPVTGRHELHLIPKSLEVAIGNAVYPSLIASQGGYYTKNNYDSLLKKVGTKLATHSDRPHLPFRFNVIDSKVLNAWCLPGGKIAFHRGIIEKMAKEKSTFGVGKFSLEEKMAAVAGHEITHATARHGASSIEFGAFLFLVLKTCQVALHIFMIKKAKEKDPEGKHEYKKMIPLVDILFNQLFSLVSSLIISHESRKNELEADKYGMVYLHRAGYNPKAAIWLQEFFAKEHPKTHQPLLDKITGLFRSHPFSEERAKANRKTLKAIKAGELK